MKLKSKKGRWAAAIIGILIILAALVLWHFRAELHALSVARQYTPEELEDQLAGNDQTVQDAVDAAPDVSVRAPTEEERQALKDGSITEEELIQRITEGGSGNSGISDSAASGPSTSGGSAAPTAPANQLPVSSQEPSYSQQLSALVARVYVLREEYLNALANMESAAKADYRAIPESQRTARRLASLASGYLSRANALEKQCDAQMDAVIGEMERLIQQNHGDMSLPQTVYDSYANEKSLKKAWYLARLEEKGLI